MKQAHNFNISSLKIGIQRYSTLFILLTFINTCSRKFHESTISKHPSSKYPYAQVEPSIAINPNNPNELIAGTVLNDYYFSKNNGKTWKSSTLTSQYGVHGDPVVLIDGRGNYYYFHLSNPKNGYRLDRIVCQRTSSLDEPMKTVGATEPNGKMHDKHWAAIDPKNGTIHMAWTQFDKYDSKSPLDSTIIVYSNSKNQGETWSKPLRISKLAGNCLDNSGTIEGVSICIGLNSEVFVTYCLNNEIYLNCSLDGGQNWFAKDLKIAEQIGGWSFSVPGVYRVNGFPSIQIDRSNSPNRGRLYLSWSDQKNGNTDTDIWIKYGDDFGKTWSNQSKINDDNTSKHQFLSVMRVDPLTGTVATLFYDRRHHDDWSTDVYLAWSTDGGKTFKNEKVNSSSFIPDPKKFFGDYLALDIHNNIVHAMWPEMHGGKISLKYIRKDLKK